MGPSDRFTHVMDYYWIVGIYVVTIMQGPKRSFYLV